MPQQDFSLPTEFTVSQLERLSELVMTANSHHPNPADHNLGRKLQEYCSTGHWMQRLRRTG